jgi:uncharacterized protein YneR
LAEEKGFIIDGELNPKTKATEITNWLKEEFELGHGHAMAIYATFKGKTEVKTDINKILEKKGQKNKPQYL